MLKPVVLAAVGALLFISASMTAEVFYAKDVIGTTDAGYAVLYAAWMLGMAVGAIALPQRVPPAAMAAVALVALGIQGLGMAAQTTWAVLPMALAGYLVGGVGHGVKNALIRTVIAQRVPRARHGRAFAAYNAARNAAEVGALGAGGLLVTALGARGALVIAASAPWSPPCSGSPRYASAASAACRPASSPSRTTPGSDSSRETRGESAGGRIENSASSPPSSRASSAARRPGRSR